MTASSSEHEGTAPQGGDGERTERQIEREREEARFQSVIVKRTDEALRHPDDILEIAIREGGEQIRRSTLSLGLSAIGAGSILAFTVMAVGVVAAIAEAQGAEAARLAVAAAYPLGFVLCIMSGAQLFTEHTALAVYPVLDRRSGVVGLLRVWATVLVGNLLGAALGAGLLAVADGVVDAAAGYGVIAQHALGYDLATLFFSSILAGWLMAVGGWLVLATPPTVSQILVIYIVTFLIGMGRLHHSIAGAGELFAAWFTGARLDPLACAGMVVCTAVGNLVGGSLFVAVFNYGHIRQTRVAENQRSRG